MDIDALKTLLLVAQHGGFAPAARRLNVDPSSVSRAVAGVEDQLGVRLFHRSTRRLTLTEEGRIYLVRLRPLIEGLEEAEHLAKSNKVEPRGVLRMTTSHAYGTQVLTPLLGQFQDTYPHLTVDLHLSDRPRDVVAAGFDLALRLAPAPKGDFICSKLHHTKYHVVVAPNRFDVPDHPTDLTALPCLRQNLPDFRDAWRFRKGGEEVSIPVTGTTLHSSPLALREAARRGQGAALLADWMVQDDLHTGRLQALWLDWDVTATSFETAAWLIYPTRRHLPARTRVMVDFLTHHLRPTSGPNLRAVP